MKRPLACALCLAVAAMFPACSSRESPTAQAPTNQSAPTGAKPANAVTETKPATQSGELQPGQAGGSYTANGETVELKYSYAGRAVRFGTESLVVLVTDKPIPAEAVAEEIKSTPLLNDDQIRGLEYVIDENSMWVRFHPSQYQESSSNKIKDYKVENDVVRGFDDAGSGLTDGKYSRSVKFVATIAK